MFPQFGGDKFITLWMGADGCRSKTLECEEQMDLGKWRHSVACQFPLLRNSNYAETREYSHPDSKQMNKM